MADAGHTTHTLQEAVSILDSGLRSFMQTVESKPETMPLRTELEPCFLLIDQLTNWEAVLMTGRFRSLLLSLLSSLDRIIQRAVDQGLLSYRDVGANPDEPTLPFLLETILLIGPELRISKDQMTAGLAIPLEFAHLWNVERLKAGLARQGITSIHEAALTAIIQRPGTLFKIARGKEPVPGTDAVLLDCLQLSELAGKPTIKGQIADFKEIHTIVNVSQGQPILKKIPATPGVPGFTVFGETIPCHDGEDIPFPEIPFTEYSPDHLTLRSAIDGCAFMDDGQIYVVPLLDIQENVDYSTGNINASVAIQVCQDVLSGFRVESLQDIIVKGTTEGGTLLSKRNIFLPGGVQGKREALIQAEKHIDAKFINEATVCAKGIIRVHGPVILSTLRCHRLDVEGNEAEIKGGLIEAVQDVIADSIGSERGAKTTIRLGYDLEELESRIAKSAEIIQKKKEKIQDEEQALETLRLFKQSNQGLPPGKEKLREKLETTLDHARASLAEKEAEHQTLLDTLQDARSMLRTIRVRSTMLSGTEVQIGPHSQVIKNPTGPATILVMNDALQILPFQDRSFIDEQEAMIE